MVGDPDDHRPQSSWAVIVDPGDGSERVDDLALIVEHVGPGDAIPTHVHRVNEVILPRGPARVRLRDRVHAVDDGSIIFVPAGVPHGLRNDGQVPLRIDAVFPTTRVWIRYLDRNPAPGTDTESPQPAATYDFRTGEVELDP